MHLHLWKMLLIFHCLLLKHTHWDIWNRTLVLFYNNIFFSLCKFFFLNKAKGICSKSRVFSGRQEKEKNRPPFFGRLSRETIVIHGFMQQPSQMTKKYGATVRLHRIFGRGDGICAFSGVSHAKMFFAFGHAHFYLSSFAYLVPTRHYQCLA